MMVIETKALKDLAKYAGICYDSRAVKDNYIFICIRGEKVDGHDYAIKAVEQGASLLVYEQGALDVTTIKELQAINQKLRASNTELYELEFLEVTDTRLELAKLSSLYYGEPSKTLNVIGITGTNGKTTVSHIIQELLAAKDKCASLGTIGLRKSPGAEYKELGNTTPQSTDLQKIFAELIDDGYSYTTAEISSHALEQSRVSFIDLKGIVVTNLTQDHLDYHMTMDKYFAAKAKIFELKHDYALLNADDDYYERFKAAAEARPGKIFSYAVDTAADLQAVNIQYHDDGMNFDLLISEKFGAATKLSLELKLNGLFNVYNSIAAIGVALLEGMSPAEIKTAIEGAPPVAGRFEVLKTANSPMCIVDYAHSPDGLENILVGARELLKSNNKDGSKLVCLFGCGGDRDITKRPKMGKIAFDLADELYVTSDNPRSEDPDQIIADILTGIPDMTKVKVVADRAQAIKESIANAGKDDIVVVAGKGHEDYQILKTGTIHFDDREQVRLAIE